MPSTTPPSTSKLDPTDQQATDCTGSGAPDTADTVTERILDEINRLGNGSSVLWKLFFICMAPGILNGLHVSSYVFLGETPTNLTCVIPQLNVNWDLHEIQEISTKSVNNRCNIRNWDYDQLASMNFSAAWDYVNSPTTILPAEVTCLSKSGNFFHYDNEGNSIVPEWDLVCEREMMRTAVQVALSVGKFLGAFLFGIVADKYGRKTSITVSSLMYIVCGPLAAVAQSYWLFVMARVGLGLAGSGVYHSAYTILTEFASPKYRSTLSIFFSVSYPIGMTILALTAYLVRPWRMLQLALSVPAFLLIIHYFFQKESPRWLITKGKLSEAHRIVFGKPLDKDHTQLSQELAKQRQSITELQMSSCEKFAHNVSEGLSELRGLYGNAKLRGRLLICHFTFFVTSLTYYVTALNGSNFLANQYSYVAVTGITEVPSYIVPCIMFKFMGRKAVSLLLFMVAGAALLSLLLIPREHVDLIIGVAMFGRTCISAVFAVIILHTAELFPTHLRSSAIGLSSTMAHVGSISAPYIADILGTIAWYIPTTICGGIAIVAGLLVLLLPETENANLDEGEDERPSDAGRLH